MDGCYVFSSLPCGRAKHNHPTFSFIRLWDGCEKAYTIDANGNVTTNEAGIVSEYGAFFPTEPGRAALVTKPDIDTGERGTGVVHVVKIALDANHDGIMGLSFGGPDNTSSQRPFIFWINSDYDRGHSVDGDDWEEDDLASNDRDARLPGSSIIAPDYGYDAYVPFVGLVPKIPSMRDLEDYTRLWAAGLSSLMVVMPTNYTVQLTLTGDGQLRLFRAVESDGSTNYLFDELTASNQVARSSSLFVGLLTSSSPITLSGQTNLGEHFIWCGAQRGSAEVHLQVLDGDQRLVADSVTYIQLKDIKEMYERFTVGDWTSGTNSPALKAMLASEELPSGVRAFHYSDPTNSNLPYILHVHGWNMSRWEKDRFAETSYKRLYWQGYQGRFGSFRWPTQTGVTSYNPGEFRAWQSAEGLRNLLGQLNTRYPGQVRLTAHSMGNVVAVQALRTNTTLVSVYVAMQAAVPAGAYDALAPSRAIPWPFDDGTPELYRSYCSTPSAPYFDGVQGAGVYINFYNANDFALNFWTTDQNIKPKMIVNAYSFDATTGTFYHKQGTLPGQRVLTCPTNTFELFAYCVEGRCLALGAQDNVAGAFVTAQQANLNSLFSFGSAHKGHSGQFRSTNMKRSSFWALLATKLGVK